MTPARSIRRRIKAARKRDALWVRALDVLRLFGTAEGRSRLCTRFVHGGEVHQTSGDTAVDRYPELFRLAARMRPRAKRILSFGCSTGQELLSLRRRFFAAEIVGAEINPRSRRIARRFVSHDERILIVPPQGVEGSFDIVFALAVFQREPHKIAEMDVADLTPFYPFARFDAAVAQLVQLLCPAGLLCIDHAHYRVEDSSAAAQLQAVAGAPRAHGELFGCDGRRLEGAEAATLFVKV